MKNRIVINGKTYREKHMKAENISMGNMRSGRDGEVLAAPPLFLEESGHSGGIPVDSGGMKFSRRLC